MDHAKKTAISVVSRLSDDDIVSIVAFAEDVKVILDPKPAFERQYIEKLIIRRFPIIIIITPGNKIPMIISINLILDFIIICFI